MKPTPQISPQPHIRGEASGLSPRAFPLTDHSFQPSAKTLPGTGVAEKKRAELHTFRKMSRDFLGAEMTRDYVTEMIFFIAMSSVVAWPMAEAIHQLTRWMI